MASNRRQIMILSSVAAAALLLWGLSMVHPSYASPPAVPGRAPGLELHFFRWPGVPFKAGESVKPGDPIAISYRNLGNESLWALIFAYDAAGDLHWLYPHMNHPEELSVQLWASSGERNLDGQVARLDDLPPGPLTIFALVTPGIMLTGRIDHLLPSERNRPSLLNRFPDSVVIELPLIVEPK